MSGAPPQADHSPDPVGGPAAGDGGIWHRIREHKIIQWALGYLAAALALTHAEELIARAFQWPEFISRALIVVLALGLPIAITLAWYHGHRASRHITGAEASIIAILLLIGSGLLWALVRPHEPVVTQSVAEHAAAPTTSPVLPAAVPVAPVSTAAPLAPAPNSGKPRIAILPFENLSPDPANAFFTDGLHEEIISTLSNRAPDLEVISRTTMMTYRTANKPVQEIARELGATHVLEGSVRREGNTVLLTLQLINARIDQHIWSHDYPGTLKSALTLQSEVANEVASQLAVKLSENSQQFGAPTTSAAAYDLYLKALLQLRNGIAGPGDDTLTLLTQALAYDPGFALAYTQRARTRMVLYNTNVDVSEDNLRAIREDLAASQRLAPNDPTLLYARAFFEYLDRQPIERVLASYRLADAAGGADPIWLAAEAGALLRAARVDEASRLLQRAISLDPGDQTLLLVASVYYVRMRRPAEALRAINLGLRQFPGPRAADARALILNIFAGNPLPASFDLSGRSPIAVEDICGALRREQRYRDLESLLAGLAYDAFPAATDAGVGLGMRPTAELRGWVQLLLGNRTLAIKEGREVLDFAARQRATRTNARLLQLLSAEGWLFTGDVERARATARAAVSKQVDDNGFPVAPQMLAQNAQVLAWAGAPDEATEILEQLSVSIPGLAPGLIARDPLYTVPLAGNARYKALQAKLEAQMAATKLE